MKTILLWLCLSAAALAQPPAQRLGGGEGHGGDPLYNALLKQRDFAVDQLLSKVRTSWLIGVKADSDILAFYNQEKLRAQLIDELRHSPIELRASNPNGRCGQTDNFAHATIYLSRAECPAIDQIRENLAEMFTGEASHHLKKDDDFAARFANAMGLAYRTGVPVAGLWTAQLEDGAEMSWLNLNANTATSDGYFSYRNATGTEPFENMKVTEWRQDIGWMKIQGDFMIHYDGHACHFPFEIVGTFDADGRSFRGSLRSPAYVYFGDCSITHLSDHTLTMVRSGTSPLRLQFPWDFLYDGTLPENTVPNGFPWDFLKGN